MIITPLAQQFDFRGAGADYRVTIDEAPTAAAELTETVDVPISAFSTSYVTFTPTEYGAAYQLPRKEAVRAFFDVAQRMTTKLGYAMAQKKDSLAYSTAISGAGNTVYVNSKTTTTDLAPTDTLDYDSITRAIKANEEDLFVNNKYLIINYAQKQQLLNLGTINQADSFGTRDAIQKGLIGELFGLMVYATHSVTTSSNVAGALVLAETQTGEQALGYATDRDWETTRIAIPLT